MIYARRRKRSCDSDLLIQETLLKGTHSNLSNWVRRHKLVMVSLTGATTTIITTTSTTTTQTNNKNNNHILLGWIYAVLNIKHCSLKTLARYIMYSRTCHIQEFLPRGFYKQWEVIKCQSFFVLILKVGNWRGSVFENTYVTPTFLTTTIIKIYE